MTDLHQKLRAWFPHYKDCMELIRDAASDIVKYIHSPDHADEFLRRPRVVALETVASNARDLRRYFERSINAGPMTKGPSREAAILRFLYASLDALDGHAPNCAFHLDQYPWECTCDASRSVISASSPTPSPATSKEGDTTP